MTQRLAERQAVLEAPDPTGAFERWVDWTCEVSVWVEDPAVLEPAVQRIRAVMAHVDKAASRFRPDSEVMAIREGGSHAISPLLVDLVAAALEASAATDGAIDPTLGSVLQSWGYVTDVPTSVEGPATPSVSVARRASWHDVELDQGLRTITLPKGVLIDLGATAKAWAADRAADLIQDELATACVVGIGGDLAIRCGEGRRLLIEVAENDTSAVTRVLVGSGGVATSTTTRRRWLAGGIDAHHIIDPSTAAPTKGPWRTVTVAAANCTAANHAATAALVKGAGAVRWLDALGLPARLVSDRGDATAVAGWPTDGDLR
jgi:thiamine biosynthesis lipoprotein